MICCSNMLEDINSYLYIYACVNIYLFLCARFSSVYKGDGKIAECISGVSCLELPVA